MRSLCSEELLSICFIIFLRLATCAAPHKDLLPLWQSPGTYLDSLVTLSLESKAGHVSRNPAAWTLHVLLVADWWPRRFHSLKTHHSLLRNTWIKRVRSRSVEDSMLAALRVMTRRLFPHVHLCNFLTGMMCIFQLSTGLKQM